jgi:hypothetical protein
VPAPREPRFTEDVVVTPLSLPEPYRYPVPVGETWVDPQTGAALGQIEGWDEEDLPILADAETGRYRTSTLEIDARTRTSRTASPRPPREAFSVERDRIVHLDGFTAWIERREEGSVLVGQDASADARITLPLSGDGERSSWYVEPLAGYFHAFVPWWEPRSLLVEKGGAVAHRLTGERFLAAVRRGPALLALTTSRLVLLRPDGSPSWSVDHDAHLASRGEIVPLPGGDVLAWMYCDRSCMPTLLVRLRARDGHVVWKTAAVTPALTDHSLYSKSTQVEVRGDWVLVADDEGSGRFLEVLSLETGAVLRTWRIQGP